MTFKNWKDYTDQELVDIYNGEKWEDFFEFQCALNSIPFLPTHYGKEPEEVPAKPDVTSWKVGGIMFQNKEDAEEVFSLVITKTIVYDDYQSSNIRTIRVINSDNYNYPQLKHEVNYSKELYEKIKPEVKTYEERKEAWKKVKKNYEDISELRDTLADDIHQVIVKQENTNFQYTQMENKFERYLKLAENDINIALNFLNSAFPEYKELFPEFFKEKEIIAPIEEKEKED